MSLSAAGALSIWGALAWLSDARNLIELENCLLISVGVAILVSYAPGALAAVRVPHPTQGQVISIGIWWSWLSVTWGRGFSLVARTFGYDFSFFNTDWLTLQIWFGIMGGVCHLTAPNVIDGWVPARTWLRLGLLFGIATGLFLLNFAIQRYIRAAP